MTQVTRVVLKIKHLSANPRYRPDDITWTLTPDLTPEYNDIVEALITETKLNDHSTFKAIIEGGPELYEAASKAKDVNSGEGGACRYLDIYVGDKSALHLFLNTCEVSNHYWKVFMPKMTEFGRKSTTSHGILELREEKLEATRPEIHLDNSTTSKEQDEIDE
ncbi:MAG: hypothetical protein P1V97_33915 [Planctomycetota bacterium]|nr:hypothetical protein [Planctomycetota bacterium]